MVRPRKELSKQLQRWFFFRSKAPLWIFLPFHSSNLFSLFCYTQRYEFSQNRKQMSSICHNCFLLNVVLLYYWFAVLSYCSIRLFFLSSDFLHLFVWLFICLSVCLSLSFILCHGLRSYGQFGLDLFKTFIIGYITLRTQRYLYPWVWLYGQWSHSRIFYFHFENGTLAFWERGGWA